MSGNNNSLVNAFASKWAEEDVELLSKMKGINLTNNTPKNAASQNSTKRQILVILNSGLFDLIPLIKAYVKAKNSPSLNDESLRYAELALDNEYNSLNDFIISYFVDFPEVQKAAKGRLDSVWQKASGGLAYPNIEPNDVYNEYGGRRNTRKRRSTKRNAKKRSTRSQRK